MKKKEQKENKFLTYLKANYKKYLVYLVVLILAILSGAGIDIAINQNGTGVNIEVKAPFIELSEEQIPAVIEDQGELTEDDNIPTVEEVDGGQFEDQDTGVSLLDGEYDDLGAVIETFDVSTPETFKNATLSKCIYANNRYGAQCVSLARSFWWSYAGRDVSTCGTGMAKGMMDCAVQNAGDEFVIFWGNDHIQAGDWLIFTGGQYGHVGMALGPVVNGYVALLGENQGGKACEGGGSATNIINISVKNLIGGYRPKSYITPEPEPEPEPIPISGCTMWHVLRGDTMSKIMLECEGTVIYGKPMDDYAKTWYSLIYKPNQSVYDGWHSETGVGLYAGDDIEHRIGNE